MTLKQERKYNIILNRIDYYLKQADDWASVDDLDDLILAVSPTFYFKDVSDSTISMFNVSGDIAHDYLYLQMPESVTAWDSAQQAEESGVFADHIKTVDKLNRLGDGLFPDQKDGDPVSSNTREAAEQIKNALITGSDYLDYSKDDLFPKEGVLLHDDQAGAIRIQRVDSKDPSKGYNVFRNNASVEGGKYSKVAPWSDNDRTQLNSDPITNYSEAYQASKKALIAGGMDESAKPNVSLGLGATLSRQRIQRAAFKDSGIWDAAVKKGGSVSYKTLYASRDGLNRRKAIFEAINRFSDRTKTGFKEGYDAAKKSMHGAKPEGWLYRKNRQVYWEERANFATEYAQGNAEYDRLNALADGMEGNEKAKAKQAAWDKWQETVKSVTEQAEYIGATFDNVQEHVEKIKAGSKTILPPADGWPDAYGGAKRVKALQRNLAYFKLDRYGSIQYTLPGVPQKPSQAPQSEAAPAEGAAEDGQPAPVEEQGAFPAGLMRGEGKVQPVAGTPEPSTGPGPQISGKGNGGGTGADVPSNQREYATSAPYGLPLHHGKSRGEGKISSFYDKRAARQAKAAMAERTGLVVPGVGASENQPGYGQAVGALQEEGRAIAAAGENEMAEPINDYKQAAEEEEAKAKRSQAKSKIRTARANARMAKAKANEAEAKAKRSEADSGVHIADILAKLDNRITRLSAHEDPKISLVLSKLDGTIKSINKVAALKK